MRLTPCCAASSDSDGAADPAANASTFCRSASSTRRYGKAGRDGSRPRCIARGCPGGHHAARTLGREYNKAHAPHPGRRRPPAVRRCRRVAPGRASRGAAAASRGAATGCAGRPATTTPVAASSSGAGARPRAFLFAQVEYLRETFKSLQYLVAPTVGVGHKVVDTPKLAFDVDTGISVKVKMGLAANVTSRSQIQVELVDLYKRRPPAATVVKNDVSVLTAVVYKF
jgi:hypothetical protein